jgi:hypothetical protein
MLICIYKKFITWEELFFSFIYNSYRRITIISLFFSYFHHTKRTRKSEIIHYVIEILHIQTNIPNRKLYNKHHSIQKLSLFLLYLSFYLSFNLLFALLCLSIFLYSTTNKKWNTKKSKNYH